MTSRSSTRIQAFLLAVLVVPLVVAAIWPDLVTAHDYQTQSLQHRLLPPFWAADGSWDHPLGTDHLGRDMWARLVHGTRVTLLVAAGAVTVAAVLGATIGLIAGYAGGWLDNILMRAADVQLSFSPILLLIAVMAVIGNSTRNLVIMLGLLAWVQYARVVRGMAVSLREREFVMASKVVGGQALWILRRHVFPHTIPTIGVLAAVSASQMILNEAALSFLGLGVQPPTPSWGLMLNEGQAYFRVAWWNAVFPGLAIVYAGLTFNLLGDFLTSQRNRTQPIRYV